MIRCRHHDHLDGSALGIRQKVKPKLLILFFDIRIQIKIDFNGLSFILENAQGAKIDAAAFLGGSAFLCIRRRFCFYQGLKSSAHGNPPDAMSNVPCVISLGQDVDRHNIESLPKPAIQVALLYPLRF